MKTLHKKSMFFLYAILGFFTPLIFIAFTQEVFEFPKMFFVYAIGVIIILTHLVFSVSSDETKALGALNALKRFTLILPFVIIYIVSTFMSSDFYTSVWGYYSRFNGGLLPLLIFVYLAYISAVTFDKDDFLKLFIFILLSANLLSMFGIAQYYGLFGLDTVTRAYATVGQPNWLAQFLLMLLPLIMYLYSTKKFEFPSYITRALFVSYILLFWCFWLTFSMSGILAFVISLGFLPRGNLKKYVYLAVVSIIIIGTNFSFFCSRAHDVYIDAQKFITQNFVAYAEDEYLVSDPGFIRKELWKSSLDLFIASPKNMIIGVGPSTFVYEFQQYRSSLLNYSSEWEYIINKPHNYYLELLTELGVLGLLTYMYLISTLFGKAPVYLRAPLMAFYVTSIFGWPVVATSLLFWFFVGYVLRAKPF